MNPIIKFTTLFGLLAVELAVKLTADTGAVAQPIAGRGVLRRRADVRVPVVLQDADRRGGAGSLMSLFAIKSIEHLKAEAAESGEHALKRVLGPVHLTTLGVGAIIGAGIFVLTGLAAAQYAGPAIVLSFVLAGLACGFAGLCYSEFASMIPIAGSAYTYGYATLGEFVAWIIGWDLILEYSMGAATVAVGWSGYVVSFLRDFGITVPPAAHGRAGHRAGRDVRRALGGAGQRDDAAGGPGHRPDVRCRTPPPSSTCPRS